MPSSEAITFFLRWVGVPFVLGAGILYVWIRILIDDWKRAHAI